MPVTLRKKTISKGRQSLYLDIYPPIYNPTTGIMQRKHYLKLFIYQRPKNEIEKDFNTETLALAEYVRAQRQIDLQNRRFDFISEAKMKLNFIDIFEEEASKRKGCYNWIMAVRYFKAFVGEKIPCTELTETLAEEYADFLLSSPAIGRAKKKIKKNTAAAYFSRFKLALEAAFKKKYLPTDLSSIISNIKPQETHRPFLFLEELERMAIAHCDNEIVKKAGLFSAMTGFRYSDVETLLWKEIQGSPGNYYILYNQEKTESAEYYPISDQTIELIGQSGDPENRVFDGLRYDHTVASLKKWLLNADIEKHFTFHGFRHTFATLQIAAGTSIYTVSKLLGHKSIKTTEIYAKIVDSLKKEASERIKLSYFNISETVINTTAVPNLNSDQPSL
ncbi:Phage integrase family protein [Chryseobacterium rhizoplanae]|uniref:Phage integrase family protein n=1 Tax=Chryseobacterium rhizoplanae TaxID=1609531 RepID=A0A521DJ30_9FLAO|nr:site-specific integrase [Chryseobacterium rhizoplanae]SMO71739.1 Phage integrase family protein [Chryseobacterium rhizoplanae]